MPIGTNVKLPDISFKDFQRFFDSYCFAENGCWIWRKSKRSGGYGSFCIGTKKSYVASRASYKIFNGPFKSELDVLHKCDTPSCVNPNHLFLGDDFINQRDRVSKGRHDQAAKTHCINGHEFTPENTFICRKQRCCRACQINRYNKRRIKNGKNIHRSSRIDAI